MNDYLSQTGLDALKGADILTSAPQMYSSTVEYNRDLFAQWLKNIAQVHLADFGPRILYTGVNPGTFDTHANQNITFPKLWNEVTSAVSTFYQDLKEHHANEEVVILMFTEFGRRVKENGSGTDHGSGGVAFVIGDAVKVACTESILPCSLRSWTKATSSGTTTSEAPTRRCWSNGWVWTPRPFFGDPSSSLTSSSDDEVLRTANCPAKLAGCFFASSDTCVRQTWLRKLNR